MTISISDVPHAPGTSRPASHDTVAAVCEAFTTDRPVDGRVPRTGGAEEMRAWSRWIHWRLHGRARWKLRVALDRALLPVRAAAAAREAVREFGAGVTEQYGLSTAHQLRAMYALQLRYGLEPDSYYQFQLFRPERRRRVAQYVDGRQYELVLRHYLSGLRRGHSTIFVDKRQFEHWCAEHRLASLRTLAEFAPDNRPDLDAAAAALPEADLFSKPAGLAGGKGAARWAYAGGRRWRGADGAERDARALLADLARAATALGSPMLVQERLRNHPDVEPLTAGGLCTARVITIRPLGGEPYLLLAVQRMPVGDTIVDNFGQGGLAAPVDIATGRLRVATLKDARHLGAHVDTHPTTGTRITGYQLPCWPEVERLVCRAHRAVPPAVPIIGWDVAIAASGPVLVEANNVPGIPTLQIPWEEPFGESPVVACLLDYVRLRYGRLA